MKKLTMFLLSAVIMLSANLVAYASTGQYDESHNNNPATVIISDYWASPIEHITVTETDIGGGFRVVETATETFNMTRASGFSFLKKSAEVYDGSTLVTTINIEGNFTYDGSTASVTSASQTYTTLKSGYSMATFTKNQGNSGTFNDAYVKVDYKVTKQQGGSSVGSGKVEVTCNKNGN